MASNGAWVGKVCADCGCKKGPNFRTRKFCGNCTRKASERRAVNAWATRLLATYGITAERYWELYQQQGGRCALCQVATGKTKKLAVDHDHQTGMVRGLLCGVCNKIIGHARDKSEFFVRAHAYLVTPPARHWPEETWIERFPIEEVA